MNRADALARRCPFGVSEFCQAEGCMAWSAASDVKRRLEVGAFSVGLDRDREARRQVQELRDAGFAPVTPSTMHNASHGASIPLNWRKSSGDIGECARLKGCGGGGEKPDDN